MKRLLTWLIGGLPFGPRSRRAIDETLADWTHEADTAPTAARRALVSLQGMLSIGRVVSIAVVREAVDLSWCHGLGRRCGVVAVIALLLAFTSSVPMMDGPGPQALVIGALGVPLLLLAMLPPAVFLIFAWRPVSRTVPTLGAAALLAVAVLALAGWLVPLSGEAINALLRGSVDLTIDSSSTPPLTPREAVMAVTGWAGLAGASAICAAMLAKRSPLVSRLWLLAVPVIYLALIPLFTYTIGTSFLVFQSAGDPSVGFKPAIASWTTEAVLMIAAAGLRQRELAAR